MRKPAFAVVVGCVFSASMTFGGCTSVTSSEVADASAEQRYASLCAPTGNSVASTGVYIGPGACSQVTLYPLGAMVNGQPTAHILFVGYPVYGEHPAVRLYNRTTKDTREKIVYVGDPDLTLFMGDYKLGGLRVAEGVNEIEYEHWIASEAGTKQVVASGVFTLDVVKSTTRAKDDRTSP